MRIPTNTQTYCCIAPQDDVKAEEKLRNLAFGKPRDHYGFGVNPGILKNMAGYNDLEVNFVVCGFGKRVKKRW